MKNGAPVRVLLVDRDDGEFARLRQVLGGAGASQFQTELVGGVEAALVLLGDRPFDVLLLRLAASEPLGWETFVEARRCAPQIPIVALVGPGDEALARRAIQDGAQDVLIGGSDTRIRAAHAIRTALERKRGDDFLKAYRDHLAELVRERTAHLQEANRQLRDEVAERGRVEAELRAALNRLEVRERQQSEFVTNVSHELKTPLTSMKYAIDNMLMGVVGDLPENVVVYLDMLKTDCQRLRHTVEDILDMARVDAGTLQLRRAKLPLRRFVERVAASVQLQTRARSLDLRVAQGGGTAFVACDPWKVQRALLNVLDNAIKFTPDRGTIELRLLQNDGPDYVAVEVVDSGIGVQPEHLGRLTEKYFRVGEHVTGTGLGLTLAKEVVERHGGRIVIASPPAGRQEGTSVTLVLPRATPPLVVVADDDDIVRNLLGKQLSLAGYAVEVRDNGQSALQTVKERHPDAFVVDLLMPGLSGTDVILKMKADHDLRLIAVVGITGGEMDQETREIVENFGVPVIAKPWRAQDIIRCLEDALIGKEYLE